MSIEFLNFDLAGIVFDEERKLFSDLFRHLENSKKRFLVINETWYDQEWLEKDVKSKVFDEVVTFSVMDQTDLNYDFLNNFPLHKVGYFKNSPFYFDFHSYMVSKYLKIENDIDNPQNITIPFMCLNGKPHRHRFEFVNELIKYRLVGKNIVSFNSVGDSGLTIKVDDVSPQHITPGPFDVYTLGNIDNWKKHFLNVITETVLDNEQCFFITEKTYKPILGLRPFLVYSKNSSKNILNRFGFETFLTDFNDITDLDLSNNNNHIKFLRILSNQPEAYFKNKYISLNEKIQHNKNNFDIHIKNQLENLKNFKNYIF